jgi:hypothetical protein
MADYYEQRKASMSLQQLKQMPTTLVCKINASKNQASPIQAMRI